MEDVMDQVDLVEWFTGSHAQIISIVLIKLRNGEVINLQKKL